MVSRFETLQFEVKNEVVYLYFNRPESLNAVNMKMVHELSDVLKTITLDETIKIVVVSGLGNAFSAGGDIKEMLSLHGENVFTKYMEQINEAVNTLTNLPKLTIAAIKGPATGLGLSLALAADYIISDVNSKLAMNFIGIGLVPDGGGHYLLQRRVGQEKAKKLIWEGNILSPSEALEIGLIDELSQEIEQSVEDKISNWKTKPLLAMIKTKKIYSELNRPIFNKSLELEKRAQWKMRQTKDHYEGIQAFVEKRQPYFIGE
ncbi:enoyl-CoA hydratase [Heyndrickxia ginsengihumi]|uniref:Enoyl-CoA hydratase n=1 Tax=Heyndrickxia ginsengihumi TaxID=363870 RepID=A0A0A6VDG4_9BACI|nr:enoyl-CoA hydratase [Heyndrickxia ginsengihumi]KHD84579.1 enoyl-CoA hydratase [Heyndrickxia ginsengihumi]MBE6184861.1 enoyl-CoA hydratase [Bacillus sp. (in: firmicutes)]MCM3022954.1 enoyl-CoA hydratase [Heyndrickxia ginsengihumi]NEY18904.1 enoyl-CoA hydratase [Heyndrickxia ginsengihumi]